MIAVHINTQHDTDIMSPIFDNLADNPANIVLVNPTRSELEEVLRSRPNETCMFLGHGSGAGLFSPNDTFEVTPIADDKFDEYYDSLYGDGIYGDCVDEHGQLSLIFEDDCVVPIKRSSWSDWSPYIIDGNNVDLLRDREVIGIWCYASDFATKYHLRGFFTYMFVSNPMEARYLSFGEHTTEEVDEQNIHFCNQINRFINEGVEPRDFIEKLEYDDSINFVNFNYSHMIYNYGY